MTAERRGGSGSPAAKSLICRDELCVVTFACRRGTREQVGDLFGAFWGIPAGDWPDWRAGFQQGLLDSFLAEPPHSAAAAQTRPAPLGAAQQAVEDGVMIAAGSQPPLRIGQRGHLGGPSPAQTAAAASRFASLPASARHAWLAAHLAALRAGMITVAQIP